MPRRLTIVLALCVGASISVPSEQAKACTAPCTKAQINTDITTNWPDNTIGAITPAVLRQTVAELVNSYTDLNGSSSFTCPTHQFLVSIATLSTYACAQPAAADLSDGTTGTGAIVLSTSPTLVTPALGTPSSGNGTNLTSLNASNLASGTVASARGGAGTVNGVLAGNGAGAVSQGATTGLSDVTIGGAVTPTDNSGASLTFTGVSAKYDKIGDVVHVFVQLTYPTTANGSNSSVSLTGAPAFPASNYGRQCTLNYANVGTQLGYILPTGSSTTISFTNPTGGVVTNAVMSTGTFIFQCTYPAT